MKVCEEYYCITAEMIGLSFKLFHMQFCTMSFSGDIAFAFLEFSAMKNDSYFATFLFFIFKNGHKYVRLLKLNSSVATQVPEN